MIGWDISIPHRIIGKAQTQIILTGLLEKLPLPTLIPSASMQMIAETIFSTARTWAGSELSFQFK